MTLANHGTTRRAVESRKRCPGGTSGVPWGSMHRDPNKGFVSMVSPQTKLISSKQYDNCSSECSKVVQSLETPPSASYETSIISIWEGYSAPLTFPELASLLLPSRARFLPNTITIDHPGPLV